ncbi:MAG: ferredoxin [Deltaproteobacteria bacterium]|nr:ferredoxin [Deltaproteobacteria bacterium]MBW2386087.1 ferredoxin [Deltaproteobacteria bacterium]
MEYGDLGEKGMYLEVDEDLCTACGLCEERAPNNIATDEDEEVAQVIKQPVGDAETSSCTEAVDYCPTGGLTASQVATRKDAA